MLGIMRKYKQSIIIKGVFAIIVLSFIGTIFLIWGEGGEGLKGSGYAIRVNREKISFDEFNKNYENTKKSIQQIYGQPVTPELEKQLDLKKLTIETIIGTTLMRQEAKRMGVKVSDEEVVDEIEKIPYFQKNGVFDKQQYEQVLKMHRLTPKAFEEANRQELVTMKARKEIADKVTVSDQEALQAYKKQHDRLELQFVAVTPADVRNSVKVTDQELNAYLQQHEKQFRTEEEISLSYVLFSPDKVAAKVVASPEDIQTFYQKNIDRYQAKGEILPFEEVKDRVKADTIQFMAAKQAYEQVALALGKNLKTGDIVAAARMLGVPVNETPLFTAKTPPASLAGETALVSKAFFLKQGELGGPVETPKGIYLFKIKSRNPSVVPPLAKIRSIVERLYVNEKSAELAREKAAETQSKLAKGETVGSLRETGIFSYSAKGEIPGIGAAPEIMDAAFLLTKDSPAPKAPLYVNNSWYAIRLKNRIETAQAGFAKEKDSIKQTLLPDKRRQALEDWLKQLREKAKIEINPALTAE